MEMGFESGFGFYDSASTVKYLMFGLVLGTLYALFSDNLVLRIILDSSMENKNL